MKECVIPLNTFFPGFVLLMENFKSKIPPSELVQEVLVIGMV